MSLLNSIETEKFVGHDGNMYSNALLGNQETAMVLYNGGHFRWNDSGTILAHRLIGLPEETNTKTLYSDFDLLIKAHIDTLKREFIGLSPDGNRILRIPNLGYAEGIFAIALSNERKR
jgi:hypothetical protein